MPFGSKRGWPARHGARPEQFGVPFSTDAFNTSLNSRMRLTSQPVGNANYILHMFTPFVPTSPYL